MKKLLSPKFQVPNSKRTGTTLVELMVVMAIIAAISLFGFLSLYGRKGATDLTSTTQQIASLLSEARSRSVSQSSSTSWGVHFGNPSGGTPFFALFSTSTYSTSTMIGYYKLPATLVYATSSISLGSTKDITFNQISGLASASTSVTLFVMSGPFNSSTINVASSGAVSF